MATEPTLHVEDEISIRELILSIQDWVDYLWSKWFILLVAGITGGAVGLGYAWFKQPTYTAITTFVLEGGDGKGGLSQYAGMAALMGIDLGGSTSGLFQGDNILELYKSRTMLAQTLLSKVNSDSNELLIERYIDYNSIREEWRNSPELVSLDFKQDPSELSPQIFRMRDSVITVFVNTIKENLLQVERLDKQLSIIKVIVTSPDEVFSKSFNETLTRNVNDFYIRTKMKKSAYNIEILQKKVDSVRAVMKGAIYTAAEVSDATPNLNPTRQMQRIVPAQEAQFSAETNKAMLAQLLQNLELTKMNQLQEQPLIQLVDRPVYPLEVNELGKAKGLIIGGFLFGFLVLLYLVGKRWYSNIMTDKANNSVVPSASSHQLD